MIVRDLTDNQIMEITFLYPEIDIKRENFVGLKEVVCYDNLRDFLIVIEDKTYAAVYKIDDDCYLMINAYTSIDDHSVDFINNNAIRIQRFGGTARQETNYFEVHACA